LGKRWWNGYSPAYQLNWQEFATLKQKEENLVTFQTKTLLLTTEVINDHLNGTQIIGIYPLLSDNTSHFIAGKILIKKTGKKKAEH